MKIKKKIFYTGFGLLSVTPLALVVSCACSSSFARKVDDLYLKITKADYSKESFSTTKASTVDTTEKFLNIFGNVINSFNLADSKLTFRVATFVADDINGILNTTFYLEDQDGNSLLPPMDAEGKFTVNTITIFGFQKN